MEYVNLIDYLDKPELIQHVDGRMIRALHHFPGNEETCRVLVVFEKGYSSEYHENGSYVINGVPEFILKPKLKKKITGWRRGILWSSGGFLTQPQFFPTKEEFESRYGSCTLFGPWESKTIEVDDE